jgi:hypothetical protein
MPRFYFDTREDGRLIEDDEGFELPDLRTAEREALETAAAIFRDKMRIGSAQPVTIEVRTEDHRRVLAATVSVHIERATPPD